MDYVTIFGAIGGGLILLAFFMNQTKVWSTDDFKYDLVNGIGSLILVIYAILLSSIPFFILNLVWFVVSARDIFMDVRNHHEKTHE